MGAGCPQPDGGTARQACGGARRASWPGVASQVDQFAGEGGPLLNEAEARLRLVAHQPLDRIGGLFLVLVVDHEGSLGDGPFGDLMAEACIAKGIAGLVIDGCIRDAATIRGMNFPVFCRGLCIKGTTKLHAGRIGYPIRLGELTVDSGSVILGDEDGVVIVSREELPEAIGKCTERERKEADMREAIRSGMSTIDLLNLRAKLQ